MKMKFALLVLLSIISSCGGGGGSGKTKAKLEFSQQFAGTSFDGGILITAENPAINKKYALALTSSDEAVLNLEFGTWKFSVVGYSGSGGAKFTGATFCGSKTQNLNANNFTVSISATTANCSNFTTEYELKETIGLVCGTFKKYDPASNTFLPYANNDYGFCDSLPFDLRATKKFYRFVGLNSTPGSEAQIVPSFKSNCQQTSTSGLVIPGTGFPLAIRAYESLPDCLAERASVEYKLVRGLRDGNPKFTHEFNSALKNFVVLPGFLTSRGNSPFLAEIPRVLCSGNDCFNEVTASPVSDIRVPWTSNSMNTIFMRNVSTSTCPANLLSNSRYFSFGSCQVEDRSLEANFVRNQLTCQSDVEAFTNLLDVYYRNNRFYVLHSEGGFNHVKIFSENGNLLNKISLTTNDYKSVAVNDIGDIYVGGVTRLSKFPVAGTDMYNPEQFVSVSDIKTLEIGADNLRIVVARQSNSNIYVYPAQTLSSSPEFTFPTGSSVGEIIMVDNTIYHTKASGLGTEVYVSSIAGFTITGNASLVNAGTSVMTFGLDKTSNLMFVKTTGNTLTYDLSNAMAQVDSFSLTESSVSTLIGHEGRLYIANDGTQSFMPVYKYTPGIAPIPLQNPSPDRAIGICSESLAVTAGGRTETISFQAQREEAVYEIFNAFYDYVGIRNLSPSTRTLFASTNKDEEQSTGGKLGKVQKMLSTNGVGAMFSDFSSCAQLKSSLIAGSGTVTRFLTLLKEGEVITYQAVARLAGTGTGAEISTYNCDDTNLSPASCTPRPYYDLEITAHYGNSAEGEMLRLKLLCGTRVGEYEAYEYEGAEFNREFIHWNTMTDNLSRFESYSLSSEDSWNRAQLLRFQKVTPLQFWLKEVSLSLFGLTAQSRIQQLHRDSDTRLKSRRQGISNLLSAFVDGNSDDSDEPGISIDTVLNAENLDAQNSDYCVLDVTNSLVATNLTCTLPATSSTTMSKGPLSTSIETLIDIDDPESSLIYSVFTLPN